MFLLTVTLFWVAVALIAEFFRRRRLGFDFFSQLGIPSPPAHLLWGHYDVLRKIHLEKFNEWCAQYGDNFGVFWGDKPFLVTKDVNLIQRVFVKDFHNFCNRTQQFALDSAHPLNSASILHQRNERWKRLRGIITPTFTSAKLKQMVPLVQLSVKEFTSIVSGIAEKGSSVDVYPLLKRFTVDNISRTAFGIEASTMARPDVMPPILEAALSSVDNLNVGVLDLVVNSFRFVGVGMANLVRFLFSYKLIGHMSDCIFSECEKIVKLRRESTIHRSDLLEALLNANEMTTNVSLLAANSDEAEDSGAVDAETLKGTKSLTDVEVISNVLIFFMAGYETTSSALGYLLYVLGSNIEVQEKLRQEMLKFDRNDLYHAVMTCKYLDQVVQETLRLYPPVTAFMTRSVEKEIQHEDMVLPAGTGILVPVFQLHRDPALWPDPLVFRPERFEERTFHPMAFQAFGSGPRNCVGMRLALLTIKLLVYELLVSHRLKAVSEMTPTSKYILTQPDKVVLEFEKLNSS